MTLPVRTALGSATLNRKWYLDVSTDGGTTWTAVMGMTEFTPNLDDATWQDDSDMDSAGAKSQTKTAYGWSASGTLVRKVTASDATAYDPGQEALRTKAIGTTGVANQITVRFYEMEPSGPRIEAYQGRAGVQWAQQGGGMDALSTVQFTLNGQGGISQITHPGAGV